MNKAMFARLDDDEIGGNNADVAGAGAAYTAIMPVPDDAPRKIPKHPLGKPSARWAYRDAEGRLLFLVCRFDKADGGKEILPLSYCEGEGRPLGWHWKAVATPRPLYGQDLLAARPDAPVLVVEGEKSCDAAEQLFPDFVPTTAPGGCKAAGKADWTPLKGRDVAVWGDNDSPGADYAQDAARLAGEALAARVLIVDVPPNSPQSGTWPMHRRKVGTWNGYAS